MPLDLVQSDPSANAQPPTPAYAAPWRSRGWNRGTIALCCVAAQVPWLGLPMYISLEWQAGRPVEMGDTLLCLLMVAPSVLAVVVGLPAAVRGRASRSRVFCAAAVLLAAAWIGWVGYNWWTDVLHAAPGAMHDAI